MLAPSSQYAARWRGNLLGLFAVLCFSPDAALVQLIEPHRTPQGTVNAALTIMCWKTGFSGVLNLIAAVVLDGGLRPLLDGLRSGPGHVLLATLFQCTNQIGFTMSFLLADPAIALLLISLNPLWAALLGWLTLGEALPCRTIVALLVALLSLAVVFFPELVPSAGAIQSDPGAGSSVGTAFALGTGLSVALYITVVRHAATRCPKASMSASAGLGALAAALLATAATALRDASVLKGLDAKFWLYSGLDALTVAVAYVLQNLALRLITGTELALILLLQVALGPLFVYLVVGVAPAFWTVLGGSLLLAVLALNELAGMRAERAAVATPPDAHADYYEPIDAPISAPTSPSKWALAD